jgi:ATP-dependent helicase/nuclease subunit A
MSARSHVLLASAGSGKTFRLTSHFLRLVALGAPPERILASTFTRKAAGEILGRIFSRLAAAASDEAKAAKLAAELDVALTKAGAEKLLAQLARSIQRFRVRTLDAFFVDLARSISAELGLPPDWRIADEVDSNRARDEAVARALSGAAIGPWVALLRELERGALGRSVHAQLERVIDAGLRLHVEASAGAWEVPARFPAPDGAQIAAALDALAKLDPPRTSKGQPDKLWVKALQRVATRALQGAWSEYVSDGLGAALLTSGSYSRRAIEPEFAEPLHVLLTKAAAELSAKLRAQNEASARLLSLYDEHLKSVQSATRRLSFDDVAQALARDGAALRSLHSDLALRLDGAIDHLLLDEFQDTSPMQWRVLRGIAEELAADGSGTRSFFCVGDVKQSIYGWRSAEPRLLERLPERLHLEPEPLDKSWRSAPTVLAAVNRIFAKLDTFPGWESERGDVETAQNFRASFHEHVAARSELRGCVRVRTCGAGDDDRARWRQCVETAAQLVADVREQAPWASVAVLLRRNRLAPQIVARLRELGIAASDEGGNPLTDAISVQAALALLHWLEHPGDTVARFHAASSVFGARHGLSAARDDASAAFASRRAREDLLELGLAAWLASWRDEVARELGRWEARRFGQLVDAALSADPGEPLGNFLERVRRLRVEDPSSARVKVMTVHASKGLEFDAVILPELDVSLVSGSETFVARRAEDDPERDYEVVSHSGTGNLVKLLAALGDERVEQAVEASRRRALRDALSALYVATTRARHRLDFVLWPSAKADEAARLTAGGLVRHAFELGHADLPAEQIVATEDGADDSWTTRHSPRASSAPLASIAAATAPTALRFAPAARARELERVSPSTLHGAEARRSADLFASTPRAARLRGTRWHSWFECIEWLEDFAHGDAHLLTLATARGYGGEALEDDLRSFRAALMLPNLRALLSRPGRELELWRERRFQVVTGGTLHSGAFDRVEVERSGERAVRARVLDFKSERGTGEAELESLVERYRPQLEAYRTALARMLALPPAAVSAALVFAGEDRIVEV